MLTALTCVLMLISRMSHLRLGHVGMVGCSRGYVGTAVARALRAGPSCLQEVSVRRQICGRLENELLTLQKLQLLLHLLLKLLVLQLLLLMDTLIRTRQTTILSELSKQKLL